MRISLSGDTQKHVQVLELNFPFSETELKNKYLELVKKHHPDKKQDNDHTKFLAIQTAYEYLQAYSYVEGQGLMRTKEVPVNDIFSNSLREKCPNCTGGVVLRERMAIHRNECEKCNDDEKRKEQGYKVPVGMVGIPCKKCNNGKFKLKSGREVDCNSCGGSGFYRFRTCSKCGGEGEYTTSTPIQYWDTCMTCRGKGYREIDVFNPVIPRGAILR